jgi:hypothetical protein
MSPDPYLGSINLFDPQSLNRYSYVGNSPLGGIDPSGLDGYSPGTGIGGATGCGSAAISLGNDVGADIGCGIALFKLLFGLSSGPQFTGSLTPRPSGTIWDEHGSFHASPYSSLAGMIGDVEGLYPGGCEFGVCYGDSFAQTSGGFFSGGECSPLNAFRLSYSFVHPDGRTTKQHIIDEHMSGKPGKSNYRGTWFGVTVINAATYLFGTQTQQGTSTKFEFTLPQIIPGARYDWGTTTSGAHTASNRLITAGICSSVLTSYPIP